MRRRPSCLLALAAVLVAGGCRRDAETTAPRLVLGPQVTCITGPAPVCAGDCDFHVPADLAPLQTAKSLTFGLRHGCLLDASGEPRCWGDATQGQLGSDPAAARGRCAGRPCATAPVAVRGAPRLESIEAGWFHTCGLAVGGGVFCWGDDALGELGRAAPRPGAAPVEGLSAGVTQVSAGGIHSCAVDATGDVVCWGDGSAGQLGQGVSEDSATPVAVQGLVAPAAEVEAGAYHTCARLSDGSVACWGDNRFGQLGDGTRTASNVPVAVRGLAGPVRDLAAGSSFNCVLLVSGAVQCWGSNEMGELGLGFDDHPPRPTDPAPPPATVEELGGDAVALQAGGNHACAERADGSFACWGANEVGQLGDGTLTGRDVPIPWEGRAAALTHPEVALDGPGPVEGVDVSYHSGRVDWTAAVARGQRFGLTLATAGDDFLDPFFACHWERMRQAGLARGAYHFFVPGDDPELQARTFLSHVVFAPGDLAPVVDIETLGSAPPPDLPERLRTFLGIVERAVGTKPIIYTGPAFWDRNMNAEFGDYPLWIADYGVSEPRVPQGWKRWHLWQWRGNADLPEIAPVVDLDRLGPGVDLSRLLIPGGG